MPVHPTVVFLGSSPRYSQVYTLSASACVGNAGRVACSWQLENKYLRVFQRLARYKRGDDDDDDDETVFLSYTVSALHNPFSTKTWLHSPWPVIPADIEKAKGITRGYTCATCGFLLFKPPTLAISLNRRPLHAQSFPVVQFGDLSRWFRDMEYWLFRTGLSS